MITTEDLKEAAKLVLKKQKAKFKNIYEGIKATPSFLKKQNKKGKKYGETNLLNNKD